MGFRVCNNTAIKRGVENCALLGHYAGNSSNCLPTFRDNVSVPSSRASYHYSLHNNTEEHSFHLVHSETLKSRKKGVENWFSHKREVECMYICTEMQLFVFIMKQSPSLGHSIVWGSSLMFLGMVRYFHAEGFWCGFISLRQWQCKRQSSWCSKKWAY